MASRSWLAVTVAAALMAICFGATGGIVSYNGAPAAAGLGANTVVQMALTLGGGLLVALACALESSGRLRTFGIAAAVALFALAAFTAMSVNWSVAPSNSWLEANRTLAYAATFAGAIALVRLAAGRWRSVLAGVLLATVAISAYAVASKVFPELIIAPDSGSGVSARLQLPFGYWNAVGLTAALALPPCLWLGARREGHGALSALSAPALTLAIAALVLSYSRGAVLAALAGLAFWFAFVPLRLRALSMLAIGGVGAGGIVVYALRQPALADDRVALAARTAAGHRLGLLVAGAVALAYLAALVLRFAAERDPLSARGRRRLGIAVLAALALVPIGGIGALAHSSRGLVGEISHGWHQLTTPNGSQPSNGASRLTSAGSMQALYWHYALEVFDTSPAVGAGAGAYPVADRRFMTSDALAVNAHGYVFQTLADLGLVGLALSLSVAVAWVAAARRAVGPLRPRAPGATNAERIGLLTMIAVVITFTVHSAIDWTWFVPGDAAIALLAAGWVAGRGPVRERHPGGRPSLRRLAASPFAAAAAAGAVAVALVVAWSQWQPLRSEQAATAGSIALANAIAASSPAVAQREFAIARADELAAIARNPLDITPRNYLADTYLQAGQTRLAQQTIYRLVALQPSNAQSWADLWQFENANGNATAAEQAIAVAIHLDPRNTDYQREAIKTASPG